MVHLSSNNLEFSRYNPGWNGTSAFFDGLDRHHVSMVQAPGELAQYRNDTLLLIIAPSRAPTGAELSAYRAFLDRGNTIFLADDFGTGNAILEGLGSRTTILPGNLSSIDREYANPDAVIVYRTTNTSIARDTVSLVLNRPAPLEGGAPLFISSIMSWVDENGDKRLNSGELLGQYPAMTEERIGRGRLIVFSDPSIFINSMLEPGQPGDNLRFVHDLAAQSGPVLVDQMNTRTDDAAGISEILHLVRTTIVLEICFLALVILAAGLAWKRKMV